MNGYFASLGKTAKTILTYLCNVNYRQSSKDPEDIRIRENMQRLLKLLYYTNETINVYEQPDLTAEQVANFILEKRIKLRPEINLEEEFPFIIISFNQFVPVNEYGNIITNVVDFDVLVPINCWLTRGEPRVFHIMDELMDLMDGSTFEGIGKMKFVGSSSITTSGKLVGYNMRFSTQDVD